MVSKRRVGLNLRGTVAPTNWALSVRVRNMLVRPRARAGALPTHKQQKVLALRVTFDHVRILRTAGEDYRLARLEAVAGALFRRRVRVAAKGEAIKGTLLVAARKQEQRRKTEMSERKK